MINGTSLGEPPNTVSHTYWSILDKLLSRSMIILITLYILPQIFLSICLIFLFSGPWSTYSHHHNETFGHTEYRCVLAELPRHVPPWWNSGFLGTLIFWEPWHWLKDCLHQSWEPSNDWTMRICSLFIDSFNQLMFIQHHICASTVLWRLQILITQEPSL